MKTAAAKPMAQSGRARAYNAVVVDSDGLETIRLDRMTPRQRRRWRHKERRRAKRSR